MELQYLSELKKFAQKIGADVYPVSIEEWDPPRFASPGELLEKVVYIRDQFAGEYKFHLCQCETIVRFINEGYYNIRYRCVDYQDILCKTKYGKPHYFFLVRRYYNDEFLCDNYKELKVCKNCLDSIDFKNEDMISFRGSNKSVRNRLVNDFSLEYFLKHYRLQSHHTTLNYV